MRDHIYVCICCYCCCYLEQCCMINLNPLNAELNPICHVLALLGAHHILHVSRIRVNFLEGMEG